MQETRDTPVAETARQEGAQGRVGKAPGDTTDNGAIDASDPEAHAGKPAFSYLSWAGSTPLP